MKADAMPKLDATEPRTRDDLRRGCCGRRRRAVLIAAAFVEDVARVAHEQELMEAWIMGEVLKGANLPGLYPPNEDTLKRYKDWASRC
jgi:hypothetical protein